MYIDLCNDAIRMPCATTKKNVFLKFASDLWRNLREGGRYAVNQSLFSSETMDAPKIRCCVY